ncbi:hypothetical protein P43SY_004210 [Pythium insidiosum]|uniref:PrsW family intramembrane metalloprotease n=1 Tax=Pythium insidiosum TaxID=114742 RepID=A0AAD5LB05_PYTIN|nr:hypothetical protein P43SY_004210 [Pythium insidiosum]
MTTRSSTPALSIGLLFSLAFVSWYGLWSDVPLIVVLLLPVALFFYRVRALQTQYDISDREVKQLGVTLLGGIFPGCALALALELILAPLLALLCFSDQRETLEPQLRKFLQASDAQDAAPRTPVPSSRTARVADLLSSLQIQRTFGYYAFLVLTAFVVAGLVEELAKLWVVQGTWGCCCCCCKGPQRPSRWRLCHPRRLLFRRLHHSSHRVVVVLALVAAALGFSLAENVGYTFAAPSWPERALLALARVLLSTPLHCLAAGLSGIRLARLLVSVDSLDAVSTWRSKLWVVGPAVVAHGTFDLQALLMSSWLADDDVAARPLWNGLLLPLAPTVLVLLATGAVARREWREMTAALPTGRAQYVYLDKRHDSHSDSDEEEEREPQESSARATRGALLV